MFYPGSGPLDGGNTLLPVWLILMIWVLQELIYHEITEAKPQKLAYGMIGVLVLRTKPSGLYRHRRGLGLHRAGYREGDLHPNHQVLPSTQRRVPSGHGTKSSILYLHSPTVRPKHIVRLSGYPLIQDSLKHLCGCYYRVIRVSTSDWVKLKTSHLKGYNWSATTEVIFFSLDHRVRELSPN